MLDSFKLTSVLVLPLSSGQLRQRGLSWQTFPRFMTYLTVLLGHWCPVVTRVNRENWDGMWIMCIYCWTSIPRGCDGFTLDNSPLAQSMATLGLCDNCAPGLVTALTNGIAPNTPNG